MIIDPDDLPDSLCCFGWALTLAFAAGAVIWFSR